MLCTYKVGSKCYDLIQDRSSILYNSCGLPTVVMLKQRGLQNKLLLCSMGNVGSSTIGCICCMCTGEATLEGLFPNHDVVFV